MNNKLEHISGTVHRIIHFNPDTLFSVAQILPENAILPVIIIGEFEELKPGQLVEVWGKWENHPNWGRQFKVQNIKALIPKTQEGLIKYLSSDLIEGIGQVYAQKIVEKFGNETIDIILHRPKELLKVGGIGEKRAKKIVDAVKKAFEQHESFQRLAAMLFELGFGSGMIRRIWKRYGESAPDVVEQNPYLLAEEVWGIGFLTADKLAQKLGIAPDDPRRLMSGLAYTLSRASDDGHCFLPKTELLASSSKILCVEQNILEPILADAVQQGKIILDGEKGYYPKLYRLELNSAELLSSLLSIEPDKTVSVPMAESLLTEAQRDFAIFYTTEQKRAIIGALTGKAIIITGGPGTGKTTVIRAIVSAAKKLKLNVSLSAPTGRAAKRLEEATNHPAQTIHRLLKYNPGTNGFEFNSSHPLDADIVIVDEFSMVDIELFAHLLSAVPPTARIVFVGDANQLPSVGPGYVLGDLIESQKIPTVRLDKIIRQDEHGLIVQNAHRVISGRDVIFRNNPKDDFFVLEQENPQEAQKAIVELVSSRIPKKFNLDPVEDIQVISPMHKGRCGAAELNLLLSRKLNPVEKVEKFPFKKNDKVMQIANNYELGIFNGEIGRVEEFDISKGIMFVRFPIGVIAYEREYWDQLQLAYAITIHKSQGSEYPAVVMPIMTEHYIMLARNLLYTGITRARKLLVIVGSKKALAIAVRNTRTTKRWTALAQRLKEI